MLLWPCAWAASHEEGAIGTAMVVTGSATWPGSCAAAFIMLPGDKPPDGGAGGTLAPAPGLHDMPSALNGICTTMGTAGCATASACGEVAARGSITTVASCCSERASTLSAQEEVMG